MDGEDFMERPLRRDECQSRVASVVRDIDLRNDSDRQLLLIDLLSAAWPSAACQMH
jgi:hypothetical protein